MVTLPLDNSIDHSITVNCGENAKVERGNMIVDTRIVIDNIRIETIFFPIFSMEMML